MAKRKLKVLSASQYERWQCPRRGWLEYVQGHKQPTSESLLLGSRVHADAEAYLKYGKLQHPESEEGSIFLPAIPLIPKPGTCRVEQAISFETQHSAWRGAIDFQYSPVPLTRVIGDFKTTKHVKYKKTERELLHNVQAELYAYWAFEQGYSTVLGEWVYLSTGPERGASVSHVAFDRSFTRDFVGKVDERAALIQNWYDIPATESADNLAVDTTKCFEYGKVCHHRVEGRCRISETSGFATRGENMGNSILDRIAKERAKKAQAEPAPTPTEEPKLNRIWVGDGIGYGGSLIDPNKEEEFNHPAEPPVGSLAREPGEPESGFINPPEGKQSAIEAGLESLKQEDLERAGEVDERAQLKAECVKLGLCEPNSRLRIDALRKLLADHKPTATHPPETSNEPVTSESVPSMQRPVKPLDVLYVDCLPNGAVSDAHTIVAGLLPAVLEQVGEAHVKFVQYGKGTAALAVAVQKYLNESPEAPTAMFADSRTIDADVLAVLVRNAETVVRGLR